MKTTENPTEIPQNLNKILTNETTTRKAYRKRVQTLQDHYKNLTEVSQKSHKTPLNYTKTSEILN